MDPAGSRRIKVSMETRVLKNISSSIVALVTEKGAHHLDLRFATDEDPDWVTEQRRQEVEIIEGWIDQYHRDMAQVS
ncbi:hypothetical protein Zm00014a_005605 [Zea mays]|uniref:Uncharacterized protein n=1 Tax=Zea mays TaxID=4577 RepID=A0A3L6DGF6_MAIZE|nr:hypothetical protein Zm00014a_005605 [Zea mays]